MRLGRVLIILALLIILLLGGVFLLRQFLPSITGGTDSGQQAGEMSTSPAIPMVEVIVVAQTAARGTILNEDMLATIEFPQDNRLPGMFLADQMTAVVGRQVKHDVAAGTPLQDSMLIDLNEGLAPTGSTAALMIPKGMVAIPIPVDRLSSVAYALRPGDHVSVIGSFVVVDVDTEFQSILPNDTASVLSTGRVGDNGPTYLTIQLVPGGAVLGRTELDPLLNELIYVIPSEAQRARLVSQILMQDATVLRFGEFPYEDLAPKEEAAISETDAATRQNATQQQDQAAAPPPEQKPPDVVTLIVTPQEAVALEYLMRRDVQFTLVLRSSGDTDAIDTEAATFQYMLETYNIPIPAKLPYDLHPRFPAPASSTAEGANP